MPAIKKLLVANRGEVAVRILRACKELGIGTVAVHSEADAGALHVRFADQAVCIGPAAPARSYLHVPALISAAEITGADAIHPGYGFLSESAAFAEVVARCGLTFVGPPAAAMRLWGDKLIARETAARLGLPLLPGTAPLTTLDEAREAAAGLGYPLMLKQSGGGGGRGLRVVRDEGELMSAFVSAFREVETSFGQGQLYLERYLERPKHIEFQALADAHGQVWTLGERECSLQRRHQKVMEECPSPSLRAGQRDAMGEVIRAALRATGYQSLGTLEFVMDADGQLFFLEMNTRLQVEHPVTELCTGLDLVALQLRIAAGERLTLPDTRPWSFRGHAVQCRILAEDALTFAPSPGTITEYHPPGGAGVRVDSGVFGGWTVPSHYDSLVAKVITHGGTRDEAFRRMGRALDETIIGGIRTNLALHRALLRDAEVQAGTMHTGTVERVVAELRRAQPPGALGALARADEGGATAARVRP